MPPKHTFYTYLLKPYSLKKFPKVRLSIMLTADALAPLRSLPHSDDDDDDDNEDASIGTIYIC